MSAHCADDLAYAKERRRAQHDTISLEHGAAGLRQRARPPPGCARNWSRASLRWRRMDGPSWAELDAVFVFGVPGERSGQSREPSEEEQQERGDDDYAFPTAGGPLHGVELRRGKPMAEGFWATCEMEGGEIGVLRLPRWGPGQGVCMAGG